MVNGLGIGLTLIGIALALTWGMARLCQVVDRETCSDTDSGEHEYTHATDGKGWHLRCVACGQQTKWIPAFKRSA